LIFHEVPNGCNTQHNAVVNFEWIQQLKSRPDDRQQ